MKVFKIVLTGGPCAGKSTMYKKIKEYLKNKGYTVLGVDETATQLILRNLLPKEEKGYNALKKFQNMVYYYQKTQENCAIDALEYNNDVDVCIILCDRGLLDNKAYLNDSKDFDEIVKNNYDKEIQALDSYDLVLNLTSLSISKPQLYENDTKRFESPKEAAALNTKTLRAWIGHHNMKIINTNQSIEEEFNEITKYINDLIHLKNIQDEKIHYEIEEVDLNKYNDNNSRKIITVKQELIDKYNGDMYTIYRRTYKENESILLSINNSNTKQITDDKYLKLIRKSIIINTSIYQEISFIDNNQVYIIKNEDNKLSLLINKNDKQLIPSNITIKEQIKPKIRIRKK